MISEWPKKVLSTLQLMKVETEWSLHGEMTWLGDVQAQGSHRTSWSTATKDSASSFSNKLLYSLFALFGSRPAFGVIFQVKRHSDWPSRAWQVALDRFNRFNCNYLTRGEVESVTEIWRHGSRRCSDDGGLAVHTTCQIHVIRLPGGCCFLSVEHFKSIVKHAACMSLAFPTYLQRTFRCFSVCIYGALKEVHEETDVPEESSVVSETEHIALLSTRKKAHSVT